VRIVFDENTPRAVAQALRILAFADAAGSLEPIEVLHALELVERGTPDVPLIQTVADGSHSPAALITNDKSMRTRQHERAAFSDTGCIGIVLRTQWNNASLWERAHASVLWWPTWVAAVSTAKPGTLWQCPWSTRPKPLRPF
jgi:PIN like domain